MSARRPLRRTNDQRGAALAVALVLLVVLTLLGIAAVRATQTELRLAQNAESRVSAQQRAESLLNVVLADDTYVPVNENPNERFCRLPTPATRARAAQFNCATATVTLLLDAGDPSRQVPQEVLDYGYVEVVRQLPLFVSVDVMREARNSARSYEFARYSVTAGYDHTNDGLSAAEITESRLVLHPKAAGIGYE